MSELLARASVDRAVFAAQPGYVAAVVVADGVANGSSDAASDTLLGEAAAHLLARGLERAADDPHVAAWRAAFSAFGAKPSRFHRSAAPTARRAPVRSSGATTRASRAGAGTGARGAERR
jgi:DNA/RNA-binding domain of Phe-tRNA-synthetase-like protein